MERCIKVQQYGYRNALVPYITKIKLKWTPCRYGGDGEVVHVMCENITKPFYSNCFFEAVKAKIKNPKYIKITFVRHSEAKCPHFMWSDGKNDFDFGVEKHIKGIRVLWFKGYIRKRELGYNQKYKKRMENRSKKLSE